MSGMYRVLISPTSDPTAFSAELPFSGFSWVATLNGSGSASVSLPLRTTSTITATSLDAGKSLLWVERDGVLLWGGIVWGVSGDVASNSLVVSASGFHSYARRRVIRNTLTYSATDQVTIARGLIDSMEAVSGSLGIIGTTQTAVTGVNRDRTYNDWDRKNVGEALDQLAAVENGFDFSYTVSYVAGLPAVEFVTSYPPLGRRTSYVLDLGSNVELLSFTRDGSAMANEVDALGLGQGPNRLIRTRTDTAALASEPLLQDAVTFSDISVASTLSAHAGQRLSRGNAIEQFSVRLGPDGPPSLGSYSVGDIVEARGDYGYLSISGDYRISQLTTSVGDSGEVVDVALSSLEAFEIR